MNKFLTGLLLVVAVSLFVFPISFSFLPESLNSKKMLAVLGILFYARSCIMDKTFSMTKAIVASALMSVVFSVWCFYSELANNTTDGSYTTYFSSFATWLGGAYAIASIIRIGCGKVNLELLTKYLTITCVFQCVAALAISNYPGIRMFVDRFVVQGQEFYQEVNRMYGIGAALDSGGIRFSVCLILIAHQLSIERDDENETGRIYLYLASFLFLTVVGNMISRTTSVGALLGLMYFGIRNLTIRHGNISKRQGRIFGALLFLLVAGAGISIYLYNSSMSFRSDFRFAFEGFFNWVETGEFSTDSTDKLNNVMWIWPETQRGWAIGTGIFGNFVYSTDIGYCRFTLYCGLIGLGIFSLFFIFNFLTVKEKFNGGILLMVTFLALTFLIWFKVATDLFFLNALLFCLDPDHDPEETDETDENGEALAAEPAA